MAQVSARQADELEIIKKAVADEKFRKELLRSPTAQYRAQLSQSSLASNVEVRVVEENEKKIYLVLPASAEQTEAPSGPLHVRSKRQDFEAAIAWRALREPAYREHLLRDPRAAYDERLKTIHPDLKLPSEFEITVLEERADRIFLRLPEQSAALRELSENEVRAVAGGASQQGDQEFTVVGVAITSFVTTAVVAVGVAV